MKIGLIFLSTALIAGGQDLERTFQLSSSATPQELQEMATVVRAVGDIRQVDADAERRSFSIQGNSEQIALAEWLVAALDAPNGTSKPEKRKYQLLPGKDEASVVALFYLPHARTLQDLAEMATVIRSIGEIRRLFIYSSTKAMVARGTPEQIDLAEWLAKELDQTDTALSGRRREYTVPGPGFPDNVVRVFSLKPSIPTPRFQEIAVQIRVTTRVRRLFTYNAARAITLRGTPSQVEQAYQMIGELDR